MPEVIGMRVLRPTPESVAEITCPPYDVIKPGSPLEALLRRRRNSLFHVLLGPDPADALRGLLDRGVLVRDEEPCYYACRQTWAGGERWGVLAAVEVTDYAQRQIVRHEKTFDEKVMGRVALARAIGHVTGPVFLLSKTDLGPAVGNMATQAPLYDYTGDFGGFSDLHGIRTRIYRNPQDSPSGRAFAQEVARERLYIADGHHRYHAALLLGQSHTLAYLSWGARILAYNRLIRGVVPWEKARRTLDLVPADGFSTPPKGIFCLYAGDGCWRMTAGPAPNDPVGRLDCRMLERDFYPALGLTRTHLMDSRYFEYHPESDLEVMREEVDSGRYEVAVALHPVALQELFAVADAGLDDPELVMPEKSTFFHPKVPSGIVLYRYEVKPSR